MSPKYMERSLSIAVIVLLSVKFCDSEELQDGQSQIELAYVINTNDIMYILKDRVTNGSIPISPTRTMKRETIEMTKIDETSNVIEKNGVSGMMDRDRTSGTINQDVSSGTTSQKSENVTVANPEVKNKSHGNDTVDGSWKSWNKPDVPAINSCYYYDRTSVDILLNFTKVPENVLRISGEHLLLIKKYIYEWIEFIQDPPHKDDNEVLKRFGHHHQIPSAIKFQDLLLRMAIRTQYELPKILSFSQDSVWQEEVVAKVEEAEAVAGFDSLEERLLEAAANSLSGLGTTYNLHPFEFFPSRRNKDIPISDLISAAQYKNSLKEFSQALEWIQVAWDLLSGEFDSVWTKIREQNKRYSQLFPENEKYYEKINVFRETGERNRDSFVKTELKKLDKIFNNLKTLNHDSSPATKEKRELREKWYKHYVALLHNDTSAYHDEHWASKDYDDYYGIFPHPIRKVNVSEQTTKEAKELHIRTYEELLNSDKKILLEHEKLCRGIETKPLKDMSGYFCRIDARNSPWLLLMPVKTEVLSRDPEIIIFHHVISDRMIRVFQQIQYTISAESMTTRANKDRTLDMLLRKSYNGWIDDQTIPEALKLSRLVEHTTGFHVLNSESSGAEALQVNVYGSSGFYVPHRDSFDIVKLAYDSGEKEVRDLHPDGDRIATVMIYLSDDLIGGRTVFPLLGLSVAPEKGSVIYWKNLQRNGRAQDLVLHAGCPVLAGTKWVANKWLRSDSQMFIEPCLLDKNI